MNNQTRMDVISTIITGCKLNLQDATKVADDIFSVPVELPEGFKPLGECIDMLKGVEVSEVASPEVTAGILSEKDKEYFRLHGKYEVLQVEWEGVTHKVPSVRNCLLCVHTKTDTMRQDRPVSCKIFNLPLGKRDGSINILPCEPCDRCFRGV